MTGLCYLITVSLLYSIASWHTGFLAVLIIAGTRTWELVTIFATVDLVVGILDFLTYS